jgi:hypothetical protein
MSAASENKGCGMGMYLRELRRRVSRDEHGVETVEWVGMGGVAVALTAGIAAIIGTDPIRLAFIAKIQELIDQIQAVF